MSMTYSNFIWPFGAWNCNIWKQSQNSIGDSCGACHCCNIFWSRGSKSKWWKVHSMRSQNYSSGCTLSGSRLQHHCNRDSWSVHESSRMASSLENSSTLSSMENKSCKCIGQATWPSISFMNLDKRLQNSLVMLRGSACKKFRGGVRVTKSLIDVWRFKIG